MPLNFLLRAISVIAVVGRLPPDGRAQGRTQLSKIGDLQAQPEDVIGDLSNVP